MAGLDETRAILRRQPDFREARERKQHSEKPEEGPGLILKRFILFGEDGGRPINGRFHVYRHRRSEVFIRGPGLRIPPAQWLLEAQKTNRRPFS